MTQLIACPRPARSDKVADQRGSRHERRDELADLAEVVKDQVAQGIARDLAIKLLAGLVAQMVDEDHFKEVVLGHLKAIQRLDADEDADTEMNDKVADHFHHLLLDTSDGSIN